MRTFRASAGAASRLMAAISLLLPLIGSACGDSTEPADGDASVAGLWTVTIDHIPQGFNSPVLCSVAWVASIEGDPTDLFTVVPSRTQLTCDGESSDWRYRASVFLVRQDGAAVAFIWPNGVDTLVVATVHGSSMSGEVDDRAIPTAKFHAVRRSGPNPNLEPDGFDIQASYPDLEIADTMRFVASLVNAYGFPIDTIPIAWSSSTPAFATIDDQGLVSGVAAGTTTIVATAAGLRDSQTVTVLPPVGSVQVVSGLDSIIVPSVERITVVALDGAGQPLPDRRVNWRSSDATIAYVSDGNVTGVSAGTATITASVGQISGNVVVRVLPAVAEIRIGPPGAAVTIGGTLQLTATTLDASGNVLTGRPVTWGSDNGTVVSVDQTGLARGITGGPATITAGAEATNGALQVNGVMGGPLTAIAMGDTHTCGRASTGHLYCWGDNSLGQLGPYPVEGEGGPVPVTSVESFASLAAGGRHTCALNQDGAAFCWGYNSFGQLGVSSGTFGAVETVSGGHTFSRLAGGAEFTCALDAAGAAWCWGLNGSGQLGRGDDNLLTNAAPAAVVGGHAFTSIALGYRTACGLTAAGEAWCWGSNEGGNLGLGTQDGLSHGTPVHAAPSLHFTDIAPGVSLTCGITTATEVHCWGLGQLTPAPLDATSGYTELASGSNSFCRVNGAEAVSCWGDLSANGPSSGAHGVTVGPVRACAILATGKVVCWDSAGLVEPVGQP